MDKLHNATDVLGGVVFALAFFGEAFGGIWDAHAQENSVERYDSGDFELESGGAIDQTFLTYITHGELNEARDSAILGLPSPMASHTRHAISPSIGW